MSDPTGPTIQGADAPEHEPKARNQPDSIRAINYKLAHPLAGISQAELMDMGAAYACEHGMEDLQDEFRKGALLAQNPELFETLPLLTDEDKEILRREVTHKWSHPMALYHMVIMCSLAAAVQGMGRAPPGISDYRNPMGVNYSRRRNRHQRGKPLFSQAIWD